MYLPSLWMNRNFDKWCFKVCIEWLSEPSCLVPLAQGSAQWWCFWTQETRMIECVNDWMFDRNQLQERLVSQGVVFFGVLHFPLPFYWRDSSPCSSMREQNTSREASNETWGEVTVKGMIPWCTMIRQKSFYELTQWRLKLRWELMWRRQLITTCSICRTCLPNVPSCWVCLLTAGGCIVLYLPWLHAPWGRFAYL